MAIRSMKMNAILNSVRTIISIIFPLITFPYVSRILEVEGLGKVSFSSSIISYFTLLAALGVSNYAVREGSRYRNNPNKFSGFVSQVFTINIISMLISYLVLFLTISFVPLLQEYKLLLLIQSATILFQTIGVEWVYIIYEDYLYITVRSLFFQFFSLLLLFVFVKTPSDYYSYAIVLVLSHVGPNLINFINVKKYCRIRLTKKLNIKSHLKPILIIFSTTIATAIYVNSDITMLGVMTSEYHVGLYSLSSKIYTILKTVISSVIIISIPRLSYYSSNNMIDQFKSTLNKVFNSLILILLPIVVGINILAPQIIELIGGNQYSEAISSFKILSISLVFSSLASFVTSCILLPMKKEKYILISTVSSAIVNTLLNFWLIPVFQQNGAALTTLIAEFSVLAISSFYAKRNSKDAFSLNGVGHNLTTSALGCIAIAVISILVKSFANNMILYTIVMIIISIITYIFTLLLLRNEFAIGVLNDIKMKFKFFQK